MPSSPKKDLVQDSLVEALVPDPTQHQSTTQLAGWLGKSATEGTWRLYLTPQMDTFVEIAEKDIVHTEPISPSASPLGGTMVWVKAGVTLPHTRVVTQQVQSDFLSGGVTSNFMGGTSPTLATRVQKGAAQRATSHDAACSTNPHIPACQIHTEVNCTFTINPPTTFAPSMAFVCGTTVGCTGFF